MEKTDPQMVLQTIINNTKPIKEITSFSFKPGIYGITFLGSDIPLMCGNTRIQSNVLVYIGKTESSQIERDIKEHFATGKTGCSTLRRSIGALLLDKLNLKPQPRSITETSNSKYTNYMFDNNGEERLTAWMEMNLGIGFYECAGTAFEIKKLETELIHLAVPPLNIERNHASSFCGALKIARAKCKQLAIDNTETSF